MNDVIISMKNITKSFAGVKALDNVSIDILSGKVHGLIGANGAGKSTLIKILAGVQLPDSGEIKIENQVVTIDHPHVSSSLGLSFIHQELSLVENFNVLENMTLGLNKEKKLGFIDWKSTGEKLNSVMKRIGFKFPLNTPIKDLSIADKWLVAIARALYQDAKVIAMDEPTASLSESEVQMLFKVINEMTAQGIGVIYVSHRLDEVLTICDEITIFKDGKHVMHAQTSELTKEQIINSIAGRKVETLISENLNFADKKVLLELENVKDESKVHGVSLKLHESEILGITGLVGAGRTELLKLIFGANKLIDGKMTYKSKSYHPKTTADAVKAGMALVPEERRSEGLITNKSVGFNLNLTNLKATKKGKLPLLSKGKAKSVSNELISKLLIKTDGESAQILSLSGGNQQKVVIGRWVNCKPDLIIMDEPTRGVDIGARAEIYALIRKMSQEGVSFLIVSSDVEELPGLCDRVIVMVNGKVSGQVIGTEITKDSLLRLSYAH